MEEQIFDIDTFNRTLVSLKQLANVHQLKNDAALKQKNEAFFQHGPQVSNEIPDVAPVTNSEKVGGSIIEFLRTIPGVATEGMLGVVSREISIALSDRALRALLRRKNGGEVGMSINFASKDWPKHELEFERIDPNHNRVSVGFQISPEGFPTGGQIKIGTKEHGQFVTIREEIKFDSNGIVLKDSPNYDLLAGQKLDVVKMIQQVTSADEMGVSLNPLAMIEKAKQPKLEGTS